MTPNLPVLDLTLVNAWITAVLNTLWPLMAVLFGVIVGSVVVRAFRRALAGGGGGE